MMHQITVDAGSAKSTFGRIAESIDAGFESTLKDAAKRAAVEVDQNFLRRGRPDVWAALAPATIKARQSMAAQGHPPVAGIDTPLRVTDTLRKAASAATAGVQGSQITLGPWAWQNTLTLPYAALQDQGGKRIPARPFFHFSAGAEDDYLALFFAEIEARIARAQDAR